MKQKVALCLLVMVVFQTPSVLQAGVLFTDDWEVSGGVSEVLSEVSLRVAVNNMWTFYNVDGITPADVGESFTITQNNQGFSSVVSSLTNGIDDRIDFKVANIAGSWGRYWQETALFEQYNTPNGIDFQGYVINSLQLRVNTLLLDSPGEDLNEDGIWTDCTANVTFTINGVPEPATLLPGDVNGDGYVGGLDLTTIITNWGMNPATREQGDLSGDGFVTGHDYTEVITYWGTGTPPPEPGVIPEPATLGLLIMGGLGLLRRRRR